MLSSLLNKRIKLLNDVKIFETDNGIVIYNKKGKIYINGHSSYLILLWLIQNLNGRHTLEILLPKEQESSIKILSLIQLLIENNFVKVLNDPFYHQDNEIVNSEFMMSNFFSSFTNMPITLLKKLQERSFVCIGSGLALYNMVVSLINWKAKNVILYCNKKDYKKIKSVSPPEILDKILSQYYVFESFTEKKFSSKFINHKKDDVLLVANDSLPLNIKNFFFDYFDYFDYLLSTIIFSGTNYIYSTKISNLEKFIDYLSKNNYLKLMPPIHRISPAAMSLAVNFSLASIVETLSLVDTFYQHQSFSFIVNQDSLRYHLV